MLSDLQCSVVESKVWTNNGRIAALIYLKDCNSGSPIEDCQKMDRIEARLRYVLKGDNDIRSAKTSVSMAVTHTERRLHQMMFADRDYERKPVVPMVSVLNCLERGYSVVNVHCKDRAKLLFDVVCTLTDMKYVVFHATVNTVGDRASLVTYIYSLRTHSIYRNLVCINLVAQLCSFICFRNSSSDTQMEPRLVLMLKNSV